MMSSGAQKLVFTGMALVGVLLVGRSSSGTLYMDFSDAEAGLISNPVPSEAPALENGEAAFVHHAAPTGLEEAALLDGGRALPVRTFYTLDNTPPPALSAYAALAADLASGKVYLASNTERRWPLASLTKLMTAKIALEALPLYESIELSEAHFPQEEMVTALKAGERYRVVDLITVMLIASSNEAGEGLASVLGREDFIRRMNGTARAWGLSETFFSDPTGLSASNQSTADDILKLAAKLYAEYPEIFKITREPKVAVTELNSGAAKTFINIHIFSKEKDFLGGKTGFTDEASGNLVSLFDVNGEPVLITVLGTQDRFGESRTMVSWLREHFGMHTQ